MYSIGIVSVILTLPHMRGFFETTRIQIVTRCEKMYSIRRNRSSRVKSQVPSVKMSKSTLAVVSLTLALATRVAASSITSQYLGTRSQNGEQMLLFQLPEAITSEMIERPKTDHSIVTPSQQPIDPMATQYSEHHYRRQQPYKKSSRAAISRQATDYEVDFAPQLTETSAANVYQNIDEQSISLTIPLSALQDVQTGPGGVYQSDIKPVSFKQQRKQPHLAEHGGSKHRPANRKMPPGKRASADMAPLDYVTANNGISWFYESNEASNKTSPSTDNELIGQLLQDALKQLFSLQATTKPTNRIESRQPILWRDSPQSNESAYLTRPFSSALRQSQQHSHGDISSSDNRTAVTQDIYNLLDKLSSSSPELLTKMRNILRKASLKSDGSLNSTYVSVAHLYDAARAKVDSGDGNNSSTTSTRDDTNAPSSRPASRQNSSLQHELRIPLLVIAVPRKTPVVNALPQHHDSGPRPMEQQLYPADNFTMPHSNATRPYPPLRWTMTGDPSQSPALNNTRRLAPYLYGSSAAGSHNHHQTPSMTTSAPLHTMAPYAHLFGSALPARHHYSDKGNASSVLPEPNARHRLLPPGDSSAYQRQPTGSGSHGDDSAGLHEYPSILRSANRQQLPRSRQVPDHLANWTIVDEPAELGSEPAPKLRYLPTSIGGLSGSLASRTTLLETLSRLRPLFAPGINGRSDVAHDRVDLSASSGPHQQQQDLAGRLTAGQLLAQLRSIGSAAAERRASAGTLQDRDRDVSMSSSQTYESLAAVPSSVGQIRANRRPPQMSPTQMIDQDNVDAIAASAPASSLALNGAPPDRDQLNESPKVLLMFV